MSEFRLHAPYQPTGDQPEAIAELVNGIRAGDHEQTLLGVTGSGKNLYHCECHCTSQQADTRSGT